MNDVTGWICDECGNVHRSALDEYPPGWTKVYTDFGPFLDICPNCIASYEDDFENEDDYEEEDFEL